MENVKYNIVFKRKHWLMTISSIFANARITDPRQAEVFAEVFGGVV